MPMEKSCFESLCFLVWLGNKPQENIESHQKKHPKSLTPVSCKQNQHFPLPAPLLRLLPSSQHRLSHPPGLEDSQVKFHASVSMPNLKNLNIEPPLEFSCFVLNPVFFPCHLHISKLPQIWTQTKSHRSFDMRLPVRHLFQSFATDWEKFTKIRLQTQ